MPSFPFLGPTVKKRPQLDDNQLNEIYRSIQEIVNQFIQESESTQVNEYPQPSPLLQTNQPQLAQQQYTLDRNSSGQTDGSQHQSNNRNYLSPLDLPPFQPQHFTRFHGDFSRQSILQRQYFSDMNLSPLDLPPYQSIRFGCGCDGDAESDAQDMREASQSQSTYDMFARASEEQYVVFPNSVYVPGSGTTSFPSPMPYAHAPLIALDQAQEYEESCADTATIGDADAGDADTGNPQQNPNSN